MMITDTGTSCDRYFTSSHFGALRPVQTPITITAQITAIPNATPTLVRIFVARAGPASFQCPLPHPDEPFVEEKGAAKSGVGASLLFHIHHCFEAEVITAVPSNFCGIGSELKETNLNASFICTLRSVAKSPHVGANVNVLNLTSIFGCGCGRRTLSTVFPNPFFSSLLQQIGSSFDTLWKSIVEPLCVIDPSGTPSQAKRVNLVPQSGTRGLLLWSGWWIIGPGWKNL